MARNQDVSMPQECVNTLKQCLLMFCELLITGLGCSNLTSEETELFRRGSKSFFLAAIAALKLSLISHGGSEECIKLIKRFLDSPFAGEEEIKWLLSSSYNMGVQLFNMKLYALACEPFTITYVTSWVRATAENVRNLSDTESQQYTDLVLDACTKSNIFFDTLNRNGLPSEAFEIFRESMIKWANTDLAGIEKHSAHNLLQGWLKKVFSLRLRKEIDDEENLICSFIVGSYPPLQAGTVGLLLEKELLLYDDMEELDPVLSRKLKRKLLDILLDEVYTDSSVFMQRSKILQEKGRLCRLDGVEGCSDCLNYLTQAIDILLTNRNVGDDKCMLLNINLQLANNYFLRACCSQEVDPTADGFLEDIQNGLHMCEDILSQKLSFNEQLLMHLPSTIGLLQNCADLLALKGYSSILYTVYELLLTASFITVSDPVTAFLGVFGDRKVSHLFCCSLFPCSFKELTLQTLGLDLDSESMLQNMVNKSRKQVLSGFLCEIKHSYEDDDVLVTKQWEEMSHSSDDAKTIEDIIRASQALSKLAEFRQERGKLEEALKYAREALHFRLKLVNRYFKVSSKSPSNTDSEAELSEKVVFLHASGRMAVRNWPGINLKERAEVGPSQWQIINVYLESLMQVGVLSEMLGLVDDADSSFREGHQIAKAQGLVFAEGIFQSCLGETLRKRHMWDQARNSFETANCLFDQCRVGTFCNFCMQLARATLELRIADLRRRQSDKSTVLPSETVELALEMYRHAEEKIYSLVFDLIQVHVTPDEKIDFRFSARHGPDGNGTAEKLCIKSTYFKDEKGSSRNSYQSSVDGYSVPRKSSIRNEGCCAENPPGRIAKQVFNVVGPSIENTRLTRRRTTTKSSSVSVSKETVEELCSETQSKLNVGKCEIHASGKGRLGSRRGKKLSTGKKHKSHEDQIREAHAESECPGSECAASLKQVFQNAGKRHPCLLHDSDRAGEKPFCLQKWIHNQWVQRARCLLARIFLQKGKCFIGVAESHVVHTQFYKALGVIRGCNWTFLESSCPSSLCRVECVVSKSLKDHKIEEGCILYHLGIFILREQICNNLRIGCCDLECVDVSIILSWLHHAFVLCKDIPLLLQKVARILAILHVPKDMGGLFDRLLKPNFQSTKKAAYFHQLSLGPTVRQQHISLLDARKLEIFKSSDLSHNRQSIVNMQNLIRCCRVGPSMPNDLQSAVQEDYKVPCPTICLSLMDWEMQYLHNDLDAVRSHSWVLISRFDIDSGPLSILIPCGSFIGRSLIAECPYNVESEDEASSSVESQTMTAYGTLASEFKSILEESRQSTSQEVCIDSHEEKSRWWEWRIALDARLASMLRDLEEVWFGPWKSLLLGKSSSSSTHIWRPIAEGLDRRLQSLTKAGPFNVDLIQLLLQGAGSFSRRDLEKGISCLFDWKTSSQILKDMQSTVCESSDSNSKHDSLLNSAVEAFIESFEMAIQSEAYLPVTSLDDTNSILSYVKQRCTHQVSYTTECNSYQEPVVLALDSHLQALPWESLPVLRRKEVYRVPSLGSMNVLLIHRYFLEMFKSGQHAARQYEEEHNNEVDAWSVMGGPMVVVPTVDPSNTYFLLNPSGDLGSTQAAFEDMFTCQEGWEGKVGEAPTVEEYMEGLKKHELFVYFGHGSGDQYLSERRMRKMDRCAAALLMGCSSGRLHPQGDYEPVGVPLWYLMAGCPTAISNLWDVTDGDIDRFSRVLLQNWLVSGHRRPEATGSVNTHMQKSVRGECHKGKRRGHKLCMAVKGSGGPTLNVTVHDSGIRTASNIGEGRNACRLPNLIGASPVCYGIPTFVRRKTT
ncbi:hypothetical protein KP509_24G035800 [Ceratopteris richardii]|nr:hypothetical protein KP509_24G035800 [Ceratopteris richardii]